MTCRIAAFLLLALVACAKQVPPEAPDAPEKLLPIATERTASASVPGPPEGCVAKFFVRAERAACPAPENPPTGAFPGEVSEGAPEGTTCWLSCRSDHGWATWAMAVPEAGFRGRLTCRVEGGAQMTFDVVDPSQGFSRSAAATWLTQIGGDGYAMDMRSGRTFITAKACPAGQPSR